jgi:Flp pilus assembly protein TadD
VSKKTERKTRGQRPSPERIRQWLREAERQLVEAQYESVVQITRRALRHVPRGSEPYGDAWYCQGIALSMLQDFEGSYQALSKAVEIQRGVANVWYNRALSARLTTRTGLAVRDLERAVELENDPGTRKRYEEELAVTRDIVEQQLTKRGAGFDLDRLIEEQETFQRGVKLMRSEQWAEAEETFRRVTTMSPHCPPQPWGNLGVCLLMQERYGEAETALRRALEIEPNYQPARQNLLRLAHFRQHGTPSVRIRAPGEGHKIKQDILFIDDE